MDAIKNVLIIAVAIIIIFVTLSVAVSVFKGGFGINAGITSSKITPRLISAPIIQSGTSQSNTVTNQYQVQNNNFQQPTACPMDARQCANGSYVGRSGPQCLFYCPNGVVLR